LKILLVLISKVIFFLSSLPILIKLIVWNGNTHKAGIMAAILVGGEKGGTGKSTVAINLAVEFAKTGQHVLLVDCDKQQTAADFAERRNVGEREPALIATSVRGSQVKTAVADFSRRYDVVIVDSGGQDSIELRSAMG
jgi:chromosome partitioning protein